MPKILFCRFQDVRHRVANSSNAIHRMVIRRAADARGMENVRQLRAASSCSVERARMSFAASVTFMMWLFVLMLSSDKSGERGTTSIGTIYVRELRSIDSRASR